MTRPFSKIVCTEDTLMGSPRVAGTRLSVGDVVSFLSRSDLKEVIDDYGLTKQEIKDALHYCCSLQCKIDKPTVFCHNCSLRREQDGPLDISYYQEEKIDGDYFVKGNGITFLGSMDEFLKDHAGQDFWKISTDLLINIGPNIE